MIKSIWIRNFRSISNQRLELSNLSVFVGNNDAGKSNYLRALNLFFNNSTDPETSLDFEKDFSAYANLVRNKAKEISVEITFSPPNSFTDRRDIVWRKAWRKDSPGAYSNTRRYADGSELDARKKAGVWLDKLQYKYVPATKGSDYFSSLLCDLHDTLAATIETELKGASASFIQAIQEHTSSISTSILSRLSLTSSIQIPENLRTLFEVLDFQTGAGPNYVSLKRRGDGVKTRHIPIILKFLADQKNKVKSSGSIRYDTIWGYEEPENNLELSKSFDLAQEFFDYSSEIQILLTTHSSAFYTLATSNKNCKCFLVKKQPDSESLAGAVDGSQISWIDDSLGLMPFVAPYIKEKIAEIAKLREAIRGTEQTVRLIDHPTLFVEGRTDKALLKYALSVHATGLDSAMKISTATGAGANWVADRLMAASHLSDMTHKIGGLLDKDEAGDAAAKKINEVISQRPSAQGRVKVLRLKAPVHLRAMFGNGIKIPLGLEEMIPAAAWIHAAESNWLEPREDLLKYNPNFSKLDVTFLKHCEDLGCSEDEIRYVKFRVSDNYKSEFAAWVRNSGDHAMLAGLEELLKDIKQLFSN